MKFILYFVLSVCLNVANAALPAGAIWEVRTAGTSGNVNGGFYNPLNASPGTDYSQQNGPQYTFTDLASTSGTTTPCVVTSASHNFVSTDNGNAIHITAGTNWTAGWYEIVSTSGNAATLDRACGSLATITGGTYAVGGALSMGSNSANTGRSDVNFAAAVVPGNVIWVKAGTYTLGTGANHAWNNAGTGTSWITLAGYNSSRGDNPTGTNRPLWKTSSALTTFGSNQIIKNMAFQGSAATAFNSGGIVTIYNCKFYNDAGPSGTNRIAYAASNNDTMINSEFISGFGLGITSTGIYFVSGCYVHDSNVGIRNSGSGGSTTVYNTLFQTNVTHFTNTISTSQTSLLVGNTFYGTEAKLGSGIVMNGGGALRYFNNIFYGLTTAVSNTALSDGLNDYNAYNNNTTSRTNTATEDHVWTTAPGFKNVTNITGTAGSISSSTLTDGTKNFSAVTDNVDFLYIASGTGITASGSYLITSHTTTTLTFNNPPGGSGSDIVYTLVLGKNFLPNQNYVNKGSPASYGPTTNYLTLGAVQKMPGAPKKPGGK